MKVNWWGWFGIASVILLALSSRFEIGVSGEHLYKIDRLSGRVWEYVRSEFTNQWTQLNSGPPDLMESIRSNYPAGGSRP